MDVRVTVWLGDDGTRLRNRFRCVYCGKVCAEIHGDVMSIVTGDAKIEASMHDFRAVVVQCRCGVQYVFLD